MDFIRIQDIIPAAKSKDVSSGREIRFSSNMHSISLNKKNRTQLVKPEHKDLWFFKKIDNEAIDYDIFLEISGASKIYAFSHLENQATLFDLDFSTYTSKNDPQLFEWKELVDIAEQMDPHDGVFLLIKAAKPNSEILFASIMQRCPTLPRKELFNFFQKISNPLWFYQSDFKKNVEDIIEIDRKRLAISARLGLASMEVFAQEYRRLLCPVHLFDGVNLFTKYRVGFDRPYADSLISNVYVASKYMSFIGYFKSYSRGIFRFRDEPYQLKSCQLNLRGQYLVADQVPGLGTCTIFAKILADIDLKFSNLGFLFHEKNENDFKFYFTQVDSGCSFAGKVNIDYPPEWYPGDITEYEIIKNPATNLKFYNYLWVKMDQKNVSTNHEQLEILSDLPYMQKENIITAFRSSMLPECILHELVRVHFSDRDVLSLKMKEDLIVFMRRQQFLLQQILTASQIVKEYFFNLKACQEGLYRKELLELFTSLLNFATYSSESIVKNDQLFKIDFFKECKFFLEKIWLILDLNEKKEFVHESVAYSFENQDSFSTMFVDTIAEIDPDLVDDIRSKDSGCCAFSEGLAIVFSIGKNMVFPHLQESTSESTVEEDDFLIISPDKSSSSNKSSKSK